MSILINLPFFAVVRVTGEDRHTFLNSQLSNDLKNLQENQACYANYNTPKGRVIVNMLAHNVGDAIELMMAADLVESVVKRLKMFVLRAKVQFEIINPDEFGVVGQLEESQQPHCAEEIILNFNNLNKNQDNQDNRWIELPHGGKIGVFPKKSDNLNNLNNFDFPAYQESAELRWKTHEILSGYPWISLATTETCVAQMLNQHQLGGVHFRKGCYPGQEIIARAQYRGQVKRGLAIAKNSALQSMGNEVLCNQEESGLVINTAGEWNLLVIKHSVYNQEIMDSNGNVFVLEKLFFNPPE